jgi:hypothetical protein
MKVELLKLLRKQLRILKIRNRFLLVQQYYVINDICEWRTILETYSFRNALIIYHYNLKERLEIYKKNFKLESRCVQILP